MEVESESVVPLRNEPVLRYEFLSRKNYPKNCAHVTFINTYGGCTGQSSCGPVAPGELERTFALLLSGVLTNSIITFTQSAGYSVGVKRQRQMEPAAIEDTKKGTTAVSQGPQTGSQAVGQGSKSWSAHWFTSCRRRVQ